tara:strand:+ start:335 stop:1261 length:927 start_codon:yes stop_codon:yes gene_type:complete
MGEKMIKHLIVVALFSFCYMQGNLGGYAIFDYSNASGNDGFDLKRAYLSYSSDVSEELFFKMRFDVGRHADDRLTTFLKNAYVDYKCDNGDKLSIGLIGTNSYGVQEKNWGYRFIEKSVVDKYGMTNTADFGIGYSKTFGNVKTSMQLLNGEGYKYGDSDGKQSLYLSVLYGDSRLDKNDGMNLGLVINNNPQADGTDSNLVGFFGGWASNGLRLGLEHNQFEVDSIDPDGNSQTEEATSFYVNYDLNEDWDVFVRHDLNDLNVDDDVDAADLTIVGGVWNVTKGLMVAPNVYLDDANTYRLTFMFKY